MIGGDFNTNTFAREDAVSPEQKIDLLGEDGGRFLNPVRYEPLFERFLTCGYDWESCNPPGRATQRQRPDGTPRPPHGRIDWFFIRDLAVADSAVVPAVDAAGVAISDHEALVTTLRTNTNERIG